MILLPPDNDWTHWVWKKKRKRKQQNRKIESPCRQITTENIRELKHTTKNMPTSSTSWNETFNEIWFSTCTLNLGTFLTHLLQNNRVLKNDQNGKCFFSSLGVEWRHCIFSLSKFLDRYMHWTDQHNNKYCNVQRLIMNAVFKKVLSLALPLSLLKLPTDFKLKETWLLFPCPC